MPDAAGLAVAAPPSNWRVSYIFDDSSLPQATRDLLTANVSAALQYVASHVSGLGTIDLELHIVTPGQGIFSRPLTGAPIGTAPDGRPETVIINGAPYFAGAATKAVHHNTPLALEPAFHIAVSEGLDMFNYTTPHGTRFEYSKYDLAMLHDLGMRLINTPIDNADFFFGNDTPETLAPDYAQLASSTQITSTGGTFDITDGNPNLKPFRSRNFDLQGRRHALRFRPVGIHGCESVGRRVRLRLSRLHWQGTVPGRNSARPEHDSFRLKRQLGCFHHHDTADTTVHHDAWCSWCRGGESNGATDSTSQDRTLKLLAETVARPLEAEMRISALAYRSAPTSPHRYGRHSRGDG